ncbi:hypothetical protein PQR63_19385 [Herbaspirillum rhizosphaerae]|uniref:Uncharacterized protein n=1 Tax=Herbaspirillum rhizosphaerae TaxID=346179 RepID=A0ABW8ZCI9_9BURK
MDTQKLLSLDDAKWKEFEGGYRSPYDASFALRSLRDGVDVWDELWNELHHQGDVGIASYAAVPQLVAIAATLVRRDWNFYGLIATIETERHRKGNPSVPDWLMESYQDAWHQVMEIAAADLARNCEALTVQAILGVLALAKGEIKLGALLSTVDSSEVDEWVEQRLGWSEQYR